MIPAKEIREKARLYGVPESTIERDYAQNWILWALSDAPMAFKGGTCIKKIYIPDYRFSDDLDFTLLKEIDKKEIEAIVSDAVLKVREESGISFSEEISVEENFNGFEISVYFRILWSRGSPMKIKLDITKYGREKILLPINDRKIMHDYSDARAAVIKAYSLEEIFSEKLRSLFERTRPRDLYDVWKLRETVELSLVEEITPDKFSHKGVGGDLSALLSRKEYFGNAWKTSLIHQIKDLPDFEDVFEDVLRFFEKMKFQTYALL